MDRKNSFKYKLIRSSLSFTLVPLLIFLFIYSGLLFLHNKKTMQSEFDMQTRILTTQIDDLYSNMSFISLQLLNRQEFFTAIKQLYYASPDSGTVMDNYAKVVSSMANYQYFQDTYEIIYLDSHGYYYSTEIFSNNNRVRRLSEDELDSYDWLKQALNKDTKTIIMPIGKNSTSQLSEPCFSLVQTISAPTITIGSLIIQIPVESRDYLLEPLRSLHAAFGIYSNDRELLYSSDSFPQLSEGELNDFLQQNGAGSYRSLSGRYTVYVSQDSSSGVFTVAMFPYHLYWDQILDSLLPMLLVTVVLILMIILWVLHFSREFSRPLGELTNTIRQTTLDNLAKPEPLDLSIAPNEVQYLYTTHLHMQDHLNAMIQEKMELLTLQAEQRYRFLQYQINPHFMYNTLNVIGIMGMEANQQKIFQACEMLAQLLRYSLQDYRHRTSFQEEMSNIHTYLELMKMRFEHKIHFLVDYDRELDPYQLPRFTLQPFVENIFEHAFDADHKVVTISLKAEVDQDQWKITITDNGAGITAETIATLRNTVDRYFEKEYRHDHANEVYDGIGIKNTLARLHVFFHGEFSYDIINPAEGGCQVILHGALIGGDGK